MNIYINTLHIIQVYKLAYHLLDVSFWFCKDRCNDQAEKNWLHHFPVLEQKTKFKKIIADIE